MVIVSWAPGYCFRLSQSFAAQALQIGPVLLYPLALFTHDIDIDFSGWSQNEITIILTPMA